MTGAGGPPAQPRRGPFLRRICPEYTGMPAFAPVPLGVGSEHRPLGDGESEGSAEFAEEWPEKHPAMIDA